MPMRKELRAQWVKADYPSYMGSAEVRPPPGPDYIAGYHLSSAHHAISNLVFGRIKVAKVSDLNDPFELQAAGFKIRRVKTIVSQFRAFVDSAYGMVCFSKNWTSPAMWSHYADVHRGICLGFDIGRNVAKEVEYVNQRLSVQAPISIGDLDLSDKFQRQMMLTKFEHWHYEEEVRMIVPLKQTVREGSLHFLEFTRDLILKEVILGSFCDLPLDAVRKLTDTAYPGVTVFKARAAFHSFGIVPKESTVP